MKYDIKLDFKNSKILIDLIKNSYTNGILNDTSFCLILDKTTEIQQTSVGLDNIFVRLNNENIIDGYLKMLLKEDIDNHTIKLYPISLYCDYDEKTKKYSFL